MDAQLQELRQYLQGDSPAAPAPDVLRGLMAAYPYFAAPVAAMLRLYGHDMNPAELSALRSRLGVMLGGTDPALRAMRPRRQLILSRRHRPAPRYHRRPRYFLCHVRQNIARRRSPARTAYIQPCARLRRPAGSRRGARPGAGPRRRNTRHQESCRQAGTSRTIRTACSTGSRSRSARSDTRTGPAEQRRLAPE